MVWESGNGANLSSFPEMPTTTGERKYEAANGESVSDVDTGCQWFTAENMNNEEIAQNLYD